MHALALTGIMQKLMTPDHFLLFTTHSRRVFGGTQETIRLLGVADSSSNGSCIGRSDSEGFNFEENVVSLNQYIDDDTISHLLHLAEEAGNKCASRLMKTTTVRCHLQTHRARDCESVREMD